MQLPGFYLVPRSWPLGPHTTAHPPVPPTCGQAVRCPGLCAVSGLVWGVALGVWRQAQLVPPGLSWVWGVPGWVQCKGCWQAAGQPGCCKASGPKVPRILSSQASPNIPRQPTTPGRPLAKNISYPWCQVGAEREAVPGLAGLGWGLWRARVLTTWNPSQLCEHRGWGGVPGRGWSGPGGQPMKSTIHHSCTGWQGQQCPSPQLLQGPSPANPLQGGQLWHPRAKWVHTKTRQLLLTQCMRWVGEGSHWLTHHYLMAGLQALGLGWEGLFRGGAPGGSHQEAQRSGLQGLAGSQQPPLDQGKASQPQTHLRTAPNGPQATWV